MKKIALTLAFILALAPIAYSQISDLEKSALLDLYKSTKGTTWNINWDLNKDVSSWNGIIVENNTVIEINLSMNNLTGPIPATIGNLTSLRHLNLGFNKISGTIPAELATIESLVTVQLFMNQLEGQIPAAIGNLKNLKE
ncbi:MAG TPA: hypothetical protein VLM44_02210, partial [Lutibacter sp.]|nr:hypothetical protein [Lutibacter sp.]